MKIHKTMLAAILGVALFAGCKKDDHKCGFNDTAEYLVFGHYYGLCGGENCVEVFKIENGNLYEDTGDIYPPDAPYPADYKLLPSAKYDLVKDLPGKVPAQLLNEPNEYIGIPDAYDQGGYVVELKENGNVRFWRIDTDTSNIPAYLHAFTDTLRSYVDRISD